ncbi:acylphosphatase [bacterium BMS3Abin01]|nr:acylphosphatase [bacterium BMS3Abin01]HDY69434.1 acylphosphatase [Actinomycetota bacterium]
MAKRAHVYISGRVQGVCFRMAAAEEARRLGLSGWVRNRRDGRVEAVFEGEPGTVARMVEWCRQGPPHAYVETVLDVGDERPEGLAGFRVRGSV